MVNHLQIGQAFQVLQQVGHAFLGHIRAPGKDIPLITYRRKAHAGGHNQAFPDRIHAIGHAFFVLCRSALVRAEAELGAFQLHDGFHDGGSQGVAQPVHGNAHVDGLFKAALAAQCLLGFQGQIVQADGQLGGLGGIHYFLLPCGFTWCIHNSLLIVIL